MYYVSTRDKNTRLTAAQAISQGLAVDGGLLTPARFPRLGEGALETLKEMDYQQRAAAIMKLFLEEFSDQELAGFAANAYGPHKFFDDQVAPVRPVDGGTYCLELWHGPPAPSRTWPFRCCPNSCPRPW